MPSSPEVIAEGVEGRFLSLTFNGGKGNILDLPLVKMIRESLRHALLPGHRAILVQGAGEHFSFGASVKDHLPERMVEFLPEFHGLLRDLARTERPILAIVRGQCLGGGLELATFSHRVFAHHGARLGCPEVKLAVFAPVASLWLPRRIGQPAADHLLLSGSTIGASEALSLKLVDEVGEDPGADAVRYARESYGPLSASALRFAVRAARGAAERSFFESLQEVERVYLEETMSTKDALEGIRAFLEKRPPRFEP